MNVAEKYRKLLEERKKQIEIDFDQESIIKEMIEVLTTNIGETIKFLKYECTSEEFVWLSEIFREIVEICSSKEFVDELYKLAEKYPEETEEYNVMSFIDEAAGYLEED